jgi:hypothetical protein
VDTRRLCRRLGGGGKRLGGFSYWVTIGALCVSVAVINCSSGDSANSTPSTWRETSRITIRFPLSRNFLNYNHVTDTEIRISARSSSHLERAEAAPVLKGRRPGVGFSTSTGPRAGSPIRWVGFAERHTATHNNK